MSFASLKRILLSLLLLIVTLCGMWIVVSNQQQMSLNLLLIDIPAINSGLIVLLSFGVGCVLGLVAAIFIYRVLPLRWQLRQSQREIAELRKQNARPPL